MLRVIEVFTSIQGESTQAGRKCFFIRLEKCNLSCCYCDTAYAASGGYCSGVDDLVAEAKKSGVDLVEITGGEPLLQEETPALCRALLAAGFEVMIETNGSLSIKDIPTEVRRIVDCKLPDSGMSEYMLAENYDLLTPRDEVKFVVSSRQDFDYAVDVCLRYDLFCKTPNLLVSPVWGKYEFKELAQWVIDCKLPLRLQLQFHKIIWGDMPGV